MTVCMRANLLLNIEIVQILICTSTISGTVRQPPRHTASAVLFLLPETLRCTRDCPSGCERICFYTLKLFKYKYVPARSAGPYANHRDTLPQRYYPYSPRHYDESEKCPSGCERICFYTLKLFKYRYIPARSARP
ncbi:hypothetical protein DPMN_057168 [Dreissena polymorpha]|uniref:Secreted protein n=1 Tax=Dreissena polymorpha TaxID=45954 RepID=A0A9D4CTY0_DREPO|nr:hypothetical protein DPMN_057168 [Dreissena polymorpha]